MARIKIDLPESFAFSTNIPVRITDVNYGGHLGNDAVLSIIHEARMRFLSSHGYTEMNVEGISLIMTDVAISFKAEAFYGDILKVSVCASDFSRVGFDLVYKLEKETGDSSVLVATAKSGMVGYDYTLKKVAALPEPATTKLQ